VTTWWVQAQPESAATVRHELADVAWERRADGITICVTDGGGRQFPTVRVAGQHDTHGRGMSIVAALTDSWGVTRGPGTVTVWAHLPERQPALA
jgi:hypothetical protein